MPRSDKYLLIIDDNLKNLQVTATMLRDEGYLISLAQSGKDALTLLDQLIPDLILLDIMMPEMDGFEFCRIIKKNEKLKEIPVIFLTARTQTEDLAEGFNAGGVDYITKPFNREELLIRVRNHIELAASRKKIMEVNLSRDKLYSVIAHDIKSPFSNIIMMINAIASGHLNPADDDFREIMATLEKTAVETNTLLNNLLEFTRVQISASLLNPKQLPVNTVMQEAIMLLKSNADRKNITITSEVHDDITGYFDEITIGAVFRNIISNAVKFTHEDGSINISAETDTDYVLVKFRDSGVGISEDVFRRIFINNENYTSLGTGREKGSGLGHHLIKDFINRNNGKLEIKSVPGSGTEVIVYLPLMTTEQP